MLRSKRACSMIAVGFIVLSAGVLQGCSMILMGNRFDPDKLAAVTPGVTTEQELVRFLGNPQAIIHKQVEGMTVYQYKDLTSTSIAIPFVISFGRAAQRGHIVNIMVKDGYVVGYEDTQMQEHLLP